MLGKSAWLPLLLPVAVVPLIVLPGLAQVPPAAPAFPESPPLLYVRLAGPHGMTVTVYRGGRGETLHTPCTVGLRPGYLYLVKLAGMAGHPGQAYFPTLEVRGSLLGTPAVKPSDYPVTLLFGDDDFDSAARDAVVTKVVLLERPETAVPLATRAERPIDLLLPAGQDPVAEARLRGRVLLISRMGERTWAEDELAARGLPGTIQLATERDLPTPPVPPCLPWQVLPFAVASPVGPVAGPDLCIPDGGDSGLPAGYDADGRLRGLDPSDTVAEYQDSLGMRRIAVSNRVCVCVPRFLVLRGQRRPAAQVAVRSPSATLAAQARDIVQAPLAPVEERQHEHAGEMRTRQQPSAAEVSIGPIIVGQIEGTDVVGTVRTPESFSGMCAEALERPPEKPLGLIKWPDRCAALIGDVVTFTLRYTNRGGQPITHVIVSDSLAGRYEYVPGSAQSDRASTFTTRPNESDSVVLRWQITDPLPPGQSGTLTFQVRVR